MRNALWTLVFLAGTAAAQSTVTVPPGMATKEGAGFFYRIGQYTLAQQQIVYSSKIMPKAPITIKSFKIRRDGGMSSTYVAHKTNLEIYMSNNSKDPGLGYSLGWATNRGPDFMKVMNKKIVDWPALPKPATPPAPFSVKFVLDKPFTYKGKAFLLEFVSTTLPSYPKNYYTWYADADSTYVAGYYPSGGTASAYGTGCPATFTAKGVKTYIGGGWRAWGDSGVSKAKLPALDIVGVSNTAWGSQKLPFDLTPLGAPGCKLYTDLVAVFTGFTDPNSAKGYVDFRKPLIPYDTNLVGATVYDQIAVLDSSHNAMGVRMSSGLKQTVGTGFRQPMNGLTVFNYHYSSTWHPFDLGINYASDRASFILVLELTY